MHSSQSRRGNPSIKNPAFFPPQCPPRASMALKEAASRLWLCLSLPQRASVTATARAWTAACVSSAATWPLAPTVRLACLVTMEIPLMVANAKVRIDIRSPKRPIVGLMKPSNLPPSVCHHLLSVLQVAVGNRNKMLLFGYFSAMSDLLGMFFYSFCRKRLNTLS